MRKTKSLVFAIILQLAALPGCEPATSESTDLDRNQAAALELGFAMGSKLSSVALPKGLREISFAGINYSPDDLSSRLATLGVSSMTTDSIKTVLRGALDQNNPMTGASMLLDAQNVIKASLAGGSRPELMRVNRIGFVLGQGLESAAVVTRGKPTQENINTFVALTQKWRSAMPDDIAQCGLPANLKEAIRKTNITVNTADDLNKVVDASKEVLAAARKVSGGS